MEGCRQSRRRGHACCHSGGKAAGQACRKRSYVERLSVMVVIWGELGMGGGRPPWSKCRRGVDILYAPEAGIWACTLMRLDGRTLNAQSARGFALEVQKCT